MPRLSVIIPARNAQATIGDAVRSTLRSLDGLRGDVPPRDSEVVVFDDRSTDATAAALAAIDDPRLRVIRSTSVTGVVAGLGALLENTDSEFVARMDADDRVLAPRFRRQLAALDDARTDVVFSTVANWINGRSVRPVAPIGIDPSVFALHLLLTNPVSHPTMLARRSALNAVGGYRDVPAEDYDLWLRLAAEGFGMRRLALPALLYRVHAGQVTASQQWRHDSWLAPLVGEAFGQLSLRTLGRPFTRLTTLGFTAEGRDVGPDLAVFSRAFTRVTHDLPAVDRWRLERKLRSRIAATRALALR
ncbi:MAG: glycosyltransferase family 2 protein [Microbacteriaceae bacterium]